MIAALFVQTDGIYSNVPNVDPWGIDRDARLYIGPYSVVAHPPCQLWGKFAKVNYVRYGGEHNKPGNDKGCFASALNSVRKYGGVLEHPAFTYAWNAHKLVVPKNLGWTRVWTREWVCEIWQSAYGHKANKRTWLLYVGDNPPFELNWKQPKGTHQIGGCTTRGKEFNKPTISGKLASATPIEFRDALLKLAKNANLK
jgi:hypothetical protein